MEIKSYTAESFSFPLPLYNSICIGEATGKDGVRFLIFAGLSRKLSEELQVLSGDEGDIELQKNTSDRARFIIGSYENWYKKNRTPFALVHTETNSLAAIAWFGPKQLGQKSEKHLAGKETSSEKSSVDKKWHTISYRCYPRFRGKGLMKGFVGYVMNLYLKNFPNTKLWAGINTENMASDALATSLGFKPTEKESDKKAHWLVMIKE